MADAVVTGVFSLVSAGIAFLGTRAKYSHDLTALKQQRDAERERSFEMAQTGYRARYKKFRRHYEDALRSGDGLDVLASDYVDVSGIPHKPVLTALDAFWPEDRRRAGELPIDDRYAPLKEAMRVHESMRLADWDAMHELGET